MTTRLPPPTRCSTSPACRASTRSGAEHVTPAVDALLARARADRRGGRRRRRARRPGTTSSSRSPTSLDRLERAWGAVAHLNAVVSTPALRDAYNGNLPTVTAFHTDLGAGPAPVRALQGARRARPSIATLDARAAQADRQRAARLPAGRRRAARRRQGALQGSRRRSSPTSSAQFDDNVLDATNDWALVIVDDEARSPAFPRTSSPRRARPPRPTARRAGSSRCACPATCR